MCELSAVIKLFPKWERKLIPAYGYSIAEKSTENLVKIAARILKDIIILLVSSWCETQRVVAFRTKNQPTIRLLEAFSFRLPTATSRNPPLTLKITDSSKNFSGRPGRRCDWVGERGRNKRAPVSKNRGLISIGYTQT